MSNLDTILASEKRRLRITAIKVMQLKRNNGQSLVKIETDGGVYGIGEAGAVASTVRAYLRYYEPMLLGEDPLEIEKLYTRMVSRVHPAMPHVPTISGLDIALWDLAGKAMGRPVSSLLTGRLRDEVTLYCHGGGPQDWLDQSAWNDWAAQHKATFPGWKTVKIGFEGVMHKYLPQGRWQGGLPATMLGQSEMAPIGQGFERCRAALGPEAEFIVHCHNEWDLPTSIGLTEALAPSRPLWIEDPMPVPYSEAWPALVAASRIRIATGEKLELPRQFYPFLANKGTHVIHPDIVFAGGFTGMRKIADLAEMFCTPVVLHCVGTAVHLIANAHYGVSVRNFVMSETVLRPGSFIHDMTEEGIRVVDGQLAVPTGPGLGITLRKDVVKDLLDEGETYWD